MTRLVFILLLLLSFLSAHAASVTLEWDRSPSSNVIGYSVYYGPAAGTYTNLVSVGNVTCVTVTNLIVRGTYYFAATAIADNGLESEFSNEVCYTVPTNKPPTIPVIKIRRKT